MTGLLFGAIQLRTLFEYGPLAVFLFAMLVGIMPLRLSIRGQALAALVLLLAFSKFICYASFGGNAFIPVLPAMLIWGWNVLYSGAVILTLLAAVWLPIALVLRVGVCARRVAFCVCAVLAFSLALRGLWNGIKPPVVREVEVVFDDLPAELDGYRILHLSDLHISSAALRDRTEEVVRRANAAGADLIAVTGDIVDGNPKDRARDVEPLRKLSARDGVWYSTGNHEFYFPWLEWCQFYARWGIRFLRNECVFPHPRLALAGVDDEGVYRVTPRAHPSVQKAFAAATHDEFRILLRHRPTRFEESVRIYGVRLQLSGHTHGGVMPLMDWLVARKNDGRCRGLARVADSVLAISPGAGQWGGFPLRFFNDPELPLYVLRKGAVGGCAPSGK